MTRSSKFNGPLYKQNRRPRQLRGYLAVGGIDQLLEKISTPPLDEHCRRLFSTLIPAEMRDQTETILFADGILTVYTGQSHWATWARNRSRRLVEGLRAGGVRVRELKVVVCPAGSVQAVRPAERPDRPPSEAPDLLRQRASDVSSEELKQALDRLADGIERRGPR